MISNVVVVDVDAGLFSVFSLACIECISCSLESSNSRFSFSCSLVAINNCCSNANCCSFAVFKFFIVSCFSKPANFFASFIFFSDSLDNFFNFSNSFFNFSNSTFNNFNLFNNSFSRFSASRSASGNPGGEIVDVQRLNFSVSSAIVFLYVLFNSDIFVRFGLDNNN